MNKPLYQGFEWDNELIETLWNTIDKIAREKFGLSYYPNPTIEIVSYDQMIYYCNNHGLPSMYDHWSFGLSYLKTSKAYQRGQHGLAYEVIINSNPLRAYLMDTNSATMQALVLAHAICGHGHFFTNNYLFKTWTIADYILPYMTFAKQYIKGCEEKYGNDVVELILDAAHSLSQFGVDKYKRPNPLKDEVVKRRYEEHKQQIENQYNELWKDKVQKPKSLGQIKKELKRQLPEENLLYYIEKHSLTLKPWQKELIRIVRKIAQYFYPQYQTKFMNEGFASFIHYEIMTELYNQGYITEGSYLEFLYNHTQVCCQHGNEINVYAVGFAMFRDIKRICQQPDQEDIKMYPDLVGKDYMEVIRDIVANYRDETFILQFLSPKVIKEYKLFTLYDNTECANMIIEHIHDDTDYEQLKKALSEQWSHNYYFPHIEIIKHDSDNMLTLAYTSSDGAKLKYEEAKATLQNFIDLWGEGCELLYFDENGKQVEVR